MCVCFYLIFIQSELQINYKARVAEIVSPFADMELYAEAVHTKRRSQLQKKMHLYTPDVNTYVSESLYAV